MATPLRDAARADVEAARDRARSLSDDYEQRGREVAQMLAHAIGIAPEEPGWFESICDAVGDALDAISDFVSDLADMALDLLHEWAPILDLIGDIASALSSVLGLLALIPFFAPVCGPLALGLGGVAMVSHYLSAAGESGSFTEAFTDGEFLMSAAGVALGAGGLAAGRYLDDAVRVAGNTQTVRTIAGTRQVTPGLFSLARNANYQMGMTELVTRTVNLKFTQAGLFHTGFGASSSIDTVQRVTSGDVGPMRNEPASVR